MSRLPVCTHEPQSQARQLANKDPSPSNLHITFAQSSVRPEHLHQGTSASERVTHPVTTDELENESLSTVPKGPVTSIGWLEGPQYTNLGPGNWQRSPVGAEDAMAVPALWVNEAKLQDRSIARNPLSGSCPGSARQNNELGSSNRSSHAAMTRKRKYFTDDSNVLDADGRQCKPTCQNGKARW